MRCACDLWVCLTCNLCRDITLILDGAALRGRFFLHTALIAWHGLGACPKFRIAVDLSGQSNHHTPLLLAPFIMSCCVKYKSMPPATDQKDPAPAATAAGSRDSSYTSCFFWSRAGWKGNLKRRGGRRWSGRHAGKIVKALYDRRGQTWLLWFGR